MAESHVISGLVSKRSELAGIIAHHQKEITRLSGELKTVDATIKLFNPDYRVQGIKAKRYQRKNHFFEHGEAHKLLLDIIRRKQPTNSVEVAEEAAKIKQYHFEGEQLAAFKGSIAATLKRQKNLELIKEVRKDSGVSVWAIAD